MHHSDILALKRAVENMSEEQRMALRKLLLELFANSKTSLKK